jgi:hypothetical protein
MSRSGLTRTLAAIVLCLPTSRLLGGPYPGAAGTVGSTAIFKDDPGFRGWATGYRDYLPGSPPPDVMWQDPTLALGKATDTAFDVVSLGDGGKITLTFAAPIANGPGADLAVFENSFSDTYLELAYVEVSNDLTTWRRFPSHSLTASAVETYGSIDPTDIDGLGGKYRQGYGTPFDLTDVGLEQAAYVRIVDVVGNGSNLDSAGRPIYDPYPQIDGGVGFDLDAVGVLNTVTPEPASLGVLAAGAVLLLRRNR